ncbi:MAG: DUF3472 domain-containing protein [Planctomycetota bacterium]|nr:DUF3472 domain-containing protein [Planctomycetota bacterium]
MRQLRFLLPFVCFAALTVPCLDGVGQDSAPSSHMVFDDQFPGDIIINTVRVPKAGATMYTYYEALGWRGRGAGYAGIQVHPRAHLYLFSIWDHQDHTAPIRAVYRGGGTETVGFGGEGTGLKSWNFELGWDTDVWYTLVARNWPVDQHTYYGFWVRAGNTRRWTHLVTMDVATPKALFEGGTDAFIEDWSNTGKRVRTSQLRGGWKRKRDGHWHPFGQAKYSVNAWDLEPGKRSYHFRRNFNGGIQRDQEGTYYFMTAGGAQTVPTTTNPSRFKIAREEMAPQYPELAWKHATAEIGPDNRLKVTWEVVPTSTPPFAYQVLLLDRPQATQALAQLTVNEPHARSAHLTLPDSIRRRRVYYVQLSAVDLFDRPAKTIMIKIRVTGS